MELFFINFVIIFQTFLKDYKISITGTDIRRLEFPAFKKIPARTIETTYVMGKIICLSF